MINKECMKEVELELLVTSASKISKEDAISKAFHDLRKKADAQIAGTIIYMKTTAVILESLKTETYTEKFMFFFLPRQKQKVEITLKVKTLINYLEI